jgi:hypothetical protein
MDIGHFYVVKHYGEWTVCQCVNKLSDGAEICHLIGTDVPVDSRELEVSHEIYLDR